MASNMQSDRLIGYLNNNNSNNIQFEWQKTPSIVQFIYRDSRRQSGQMKTCKFTAIKKKRPQRPSMRRGVRKSPIADSNDSNNNAIKIATDMASWRTALIRERKTRRKRRRKGTNK